MDEALDKAEENSNGDFIKSMFDIKERDRELYGYLNKRINKRQKIFTSGVRSGFELYRKVTREEDPITDTTGYSLRLAFQGHVQHKCKDLDET